MQISDADVKIAATEFLSHKGENPYRVTRRGAELWEDYAPAMRAALSALSLPVQPEPPEPFAYCCSSFDIDACDCVNKNHSTAIRSTGRTTTPPVPPTKGPEDDLIAAREAVIEAISERSGGNPSPRVRDGTHDHSDAVQSALIAIRNERSRPASALPVVGDAPAWADVIAERKRQVEKDGWTPEHDDAHSAGQMAYAASAYARPDRLNDAPPSYWPWEREWWKPGDRRRDLVKAGALILAEIERLDRASSLTPSVQP